MADERVLLERDGGHVTLVLNRPEAHNPIDDVLVDELAGHLHRLAGDDSVRVLTLRGNGPSFCAGADLKFFLSILEDAHAMVKFIRTIKTAINALESFPRPVIAAVHGFVLAGGLELMLACDMCIAAEDAQIGDQHANFGVFPGGGSTQRLPRLVGTRKAKELIFMGSRVDGKQAEALGLVNLAVPEAEVVSKANEWAQTMAQKSAAGLRYMKECIHQSQNVPLENGLNLEEMMFLNYARLGDMQEGLQAFREKRKPQFKST